MVELQYRKVVTRLQNGGVSGRSAIAGVVVRLSGHYQDGVVDSIEVYENCESEHKESAIFSLTTY